MMKKRFFYEFSGTIFFEADNQTEAEKLATGISLENYIMDEELFEVDENGSITSLLMGLIDFDTKNF